MRSEPEVAITIFSDPCDHITNKTFGDGEVAQRLSIPTSHTLSVRAEPQVAIAVLEGRYDVLGDLCGVRTSSEWYGGRVGCFR